MALDHSPEFCQASYIKVSIGNWYDPGWDFLATGP